MAEEELVLKISARDELSRQVTTATKSVNALGREMDEARKAAEKTGDFSGFDKLKKAYDDERLALSRLKARRDEAGRDVSKMSRQTAQAAGKMQSAWKRLQGVFKSPLFTAATIAGVTLFGKRAVEAFAQAEQSQLKLVEAYRKFDAIGDVPIESIRELASELQSLTGTDDDLLAAAAGTLARFELTGTAIQRLLPLVNDFAILTGRDVVDASEAIGKAFMGNARALKELGIDFTRTGDRGKDLETIMAALEEKAGGAGAAFGESAQGGLARAQAAFGDLQEEIGGTLVPALTGLLRIVEPLVKVFQGMPGPLKSLVSVVGFLGAALLVIGPRLAMMGVTLTGIRTKAMMAGNAMAAFGARSKAAAVGLFALGAAAVAAGSANGGQGLRIPGLDDTNESLRELVKPGLLGSVNNFFVGLGDAIAFNSIDTRLEQATRGVTDFDAALVQLVSEEKMDEASRQFEDLTRQAAEWGATTEDITKLLPGFERALDQAGYQLDRSGRIVTKSDSIWKRLIGNARDSAAAIRLASRELGTYRSAAYSASGAAAALEVANQRAADQLGRLEGALAGVGEEVARQQALRNYDQALKDFIADPSQETAEAVSVAMTSAADSIEKPGDKARFTKKAVDQIREAASDAGMKLNPELDKGLGRARGAAVLLERQIDRAVRARTVEITLRYSDSRATYGGERKAVGGWVGGNTGGPTSDTVPVLASRGEYVLRGGAAAALRAAVGDAGLWELNHADRSMPSFLDSPVPPLVMPGGGGEPALVGAGGPVINIGEIKAESGVDVQAEVLWAMRRADRIRRERGA